MLGKSLDNVEKPSILCGPIIRKADPNELTFFLATDIPVQFSLRLSPESSSEMGFSERGTLPFTKHIQAAPRLNIYLLHFKFETPLPQNCWIGYEIFLRQIDGANTIGVTELIPDLALPNRDLPGFILKEKTSPIAHGSCRKPHFPGSDGLARLHDILELEDQDAWPALLMLSGDQVYVDDVSAPMLSAIHGLIPKLGFANETFEGSLVRDSDQLHYHQPYYFHREKLLPSGETGSDEASRALFTSPKKPVFTSVNAQNHLISLAEMMTMYLLVWSPEPWGMTDIKKPDSLTDDESRTFEKHKVAIDQLKSDLAKVRRVLAHIPSAMIFDDHDVTDDWNLTADWEMAAYQHPFSKRIIGNALIAYLVFQGFGNDPNQFNNSVFEQVNSVFVDMDNHKQNELIAHLLAFNHWHYDWPTNPPLIVLDTRTHRWRSEVKRNKPSGLMDWESLTDLQQKLVGLDSVILVSAAPVFGVKLIEGIQKFFTLLGYPLVVDAENWMAHRGAANVLLNMFRHSKTPQKFTILSGDVHYSFAYQVKVRRQQDSPHIWQITSSGIRNEFPKMLLEIFDRANRWLYAPWSPLNWFTKRRKMRVTPYRPKPAQRGERLVNSAGIGLVYFGDDLGPNKIIQLCANGDTVRFIQSESESTWE